MGTVLAGVKLFYRETLVPFPRLGKPTDSQRKFVSQKERSHGSEKQEDHFVRETGAKTVMCHGVKQM